MYTTLTCLDRRYKRGEHRDGDVSSSWEFPQVPPPPRHFLWSFLNTQEMMLFSVFVFMLQWCHTDWVKLYLLSENYFSHCPLPPTL